MHNFQNFLKSTRESKNLEQKTIADATNLSIEAIQTIESSDNGTLLQNSSTLLKNQVRRYCEYLEIPEKKIISILNKIDILYYKKSKYGKLKLFDYINRLAIIIITVTLIVLVVKLIKASVYDAITFNTKDSKTSIIYTPINYDADTTSKESSSEDNSATATATSSKQISAHPPADANMSNVIIDNPNITDTTEESSVPTETNNNQENQSHQISINSDSINDMVSQYFSKR
ncbi:DNA-binding protein [Allofrancisella frigidaquae]|uniref:DNA-binding protein n=1 Tax=Allofrancisella frigidaquae TaxID=1085644 RepID=A0A6M3HUD5_9GAMM|nr:helix-turn-helix domain-containing protein [Allofrancisella frigidaquae]QIV94789.1 DNA-binding protein [Allofrancisella frigidaquae]